MAKKLSAAILLYRFRDGRLEVFLVHPGGPFWAKKDDGAWSLPKGEYLAEDDALAVAKREFLEEVGQEVEGQLVPLTAIKQPSGKVISAWAVKGDVDPTTLKSNTFSMEWPPKSGKQKEFSEIDRGEWFSPRTAKAKILPGQVGFIDQLLVLLNMAADSADEHNMYS